MQLGTTDVGSLDPKEISGEKRLPWRNPYDDGKYRPAHIADKKGFSGRAVDLKANFFRLQTAPNWLLYQYHVDFRPPVESKRMKGALLASHQELLGDVRAFDGTILYLPKKLDDTVTEVFSLRRHDNAQIKIIIKLTNELPPGSLQCLQVMNIIWRRILSLLNMKQIGRHYFSVDQAIDVSKFKLQVIPGFQTSILQYEEGVMLEADLAHKILRSDTVLDQMYAIYNQRGQRNFHSECSKFLMGSIVLTRYNNKTYRVDDIEWDMRPSHTFEKHGGQKITYKQYFFEHYGIEVTDEDQPLLVSKPKKRDIRRGQTENIHLLPELCTLTGLSEDARADFALMKDVAAHTRIDPNTRADRLVRFMEQMDSVPRVAQELKNWDIRFDRELVEIKGRILPQEMIYQPAGRNLNYKQEESDWSRDMRGKKMIVAVPLNTWMILFIRKDSNNARDLSQTLAQVGPPMGMKIAPPKLLELPSDRNEAYLQTLREHLNQQVQMVVCILPNNKKDRYDAIKKFTTVDHPVPSQMVVARTLMKKQGLMSVATKIAIQMNCKMGGVVWNLQIPLGGTMIVGIDTYHDSSKKGRSCGGVVASVNQDCTRYFSTVTFQMSHSELQDGLVVAMHPCLQAYYDNNGKLPEKVIIFRDGVGDGQLDAVYHQEIPQVNVALTKGGGKEYKPSVAFIVVKKRINARFFTKPERKNAPHSNPQPGTVVDTVATKPTWYDFFLISQSVRQGTVGPTHYNVLWDMTGLKPEHMQRLSYKLTHLYYNWQGTIRVPAPCQYAHKLAFLCGQSLHRPFAKALADKLFFL
nr:hypothetical protein BaRGS_002209 [Batillaria attramentaria]KAG5702279.1 hypothetical protein BaRGS_002946 [Batillaria attramentaria]